MQTLYPSWRSHPLFRAALATVIDGLPGVRPGPVAGSVEEFLAYRAPAGGIVLLDLHLPGVQGAAATLAVCEAGHRPLIVSAQSGEIDVLSALGAGARGYLTKSADATEVAAAVRQVAAGGAYGVAHAGGPAAGQRTRSALHPDATRARCWRCWPRGNATWTSPGH